MDRRDKDHLMETQQRAKAIFMRGVEAVKTDPEEQELVTAFEKLLQIDACDIAVSDANYTIGFVDHKDPETGIMKLLISLDPNFINEITSDEAAAVMEFIVNRYNVFKRSGLNVPQ